MVHKTVLKVDVSCEKCKQEVLNVVSGIEGVNKIEADSEKDTLTVIGEADPHEIITCLRKAGKKAQYISVGPPPKPEEKKPDPEKGKCPCPCSGGCWICRPMPMPMPMPVAVMAMDYYDPTPSICSIM